MGRLSLRTPGAGARKANIEQKSPQRLEMRERKGQLWLCKGDAPTDLGQIPQEFHYPDDGIRLAQQDKDREHTETPIRQ